VTKLAQDSVKQLAFVFTAKQLSCI